VQATAPRCGLAGERPIFESFAEVEVTMPEYVLPDLSYDYGALEPHYSGQILELHHDKHHATYVAGANSTVDRLAEARDKNDFASIVGLEKTLAFNVSGHVLHSIFWKNLSPDGGDKPDGTLGTQIDEFFGSFDKFKAQLTQATTTVQGSGWGILGYEPLGERLVIEQVYDHQGNVTNGSVPLLVFDAWEHAYYLQYKNVRADFVTALWDLVSWGDVASRLELAKGASIPS
jgi:superoxide dismutase, Fe-Mn family